MKSFMIGEVDDDHCRAVYEGWLGTSKGVILTILLPLPGWLNWLPWVGLAFLAIAVWAVITEFQRVYRS